MGEFDIYMLNNSFYC